MKIAAAAYPLDFLPDFAAYEAKITRLGRAGGGAGGGPVWCFPNMARWNWPRWAGPRWRLIWSGRWLRWRGGVTRWTGCICGWRRRRGCISLVRRGRFIRWRAAGR